LVGLPLNIVLNGEPFVAASGATVASLLAALELERAGVAVEINEDVVPRDRHAATPLREGDRLEIVTLVGGG
jgi:thiamine biosynthesis protein ThiS